MALADHQLTLEHEKLLWDAKELDLNTSKGLLQAVIFYLIKCFAVWQSCELRQLQTNHISFGEDKLGKFVTLDLESSVFKKKRCVKRYDDPANPRSVYKILKKYRSRIPNEGPFIVRPISSIKDFICYSPLPLGVKVIKTFISNLMEDAGIGQSFVNYSLNLHSIDTLMRFGTGFHCLSSWLVKNNIKSFPSSPECSTTNCEDLNPEVSVMVSRLLDAPYPFDAVEILQKMEHEQEKQSKEKDSMLLPKFDSWMTNLMKNSLNKNGQQASQQISQSQRMIHSHLEKKENKSSAHCISSCKINLFPSDLNEDLSLKEGKSPLKDSCRSEVGSDKSQPRIMTVSSITECAFSLQVDEGDHIFEKEGIDEYGEREGDHDESEMDSLASKKQYNIPLNCERNGEREESEMDSLASKKQNNASFNCERKGEREESEMDSLASKKQNNVSFNCERKGEREESEIDSLASKKQNNVSFNCERKREIEKGEMDSLASKKQKTFSLECGWKGGNEKSEMDSLASKRQRNVNLNGEWAGEREECEMDSMALKGRKNINLNCEQKGESEINETHVLTLKKQKNALLNCKRKGEIEKIGMDSLASKRRKNVNFYCEKKEENEKNEMDSLVSNKGKKDSLDCERKGESKNRGLEFLALTKQKNVHLHSCDKSEEIPRKSLKVNNCNKTFSYLKTMLETKINYREINDKSINSLTLNKEPVKLEADTEMCKTNRHVSEMDDKEKDSAAKTVRGTLYTQVDEASLRNNTISPSHKLGEENTAKVTREHRPAIENCSCKLPNSDTSRDSITILRMLLRKPSEGEKNVDDGFESDNSITKISQTEKSEVIICKNESAFQCNKENDTQDEQSLMDLSPPTLSPQPSTTVQEKCDDSIDPNSLLCSDSDLYESFTSQCARNLVSSDIVQFLDKANQQMKSILNASVTRNDSHKVKGEKSPKPTPSKQSESELSSSLANLSRHSRKSKKSINVMSACPVSQPSPGKKSIVRESDASPKSLKDSEQSQLQFPLLRMFLEQPREETNLTSDSDSPYSTTLKSKQTSQSKVPTNSLTIPDAQKDSNELPELIFMGDNSACPNNHGKKKILQCKLETPLVTKTLAGCTSLSEKDHEFPQLVPSLPSSPSMLSLPASPCAVLNTCLPNTAEYHIEKNLVNNTVYQSLLVNYGHDGGMRTFTFADIPTVSDSSSLSTRVRGSRQTSEINLGDYFPPGTLIPAKDIHLITQQGPDGSDIVMKFKFSQKH